jgi:hypothetical protein
MRHKMQTSVVALAQAQQKFEQMRALVGHCVFVHSTAEQSTAITRQAFKERHRATQPAACLPAGTASASDAREENKGWDKARERDITFLLCFVGLEPN